MKKHLTILLLVAIIGMSTVLALSLVSRSLTPAIPGFKRVFVDNIPRMLYAVDLGLTSYYIAGSDSDRVYLGNHTFAPHVVAADLHSGDTLIRRIKGLPPNEDYRLALRITGSRFSLASGTTPVVFTGDVITWLIDSANYHPAYFSDLLIVSPQSAVLRMITGDPMEYMLKKESAVDARNVYAADLLQKQVDGLFCKEGRLLFNPMHGLVLYPYLYRNEVVVADTNLCLVRRIKTIDPVDSVRFTVARKRSGAITTASPVRVVNRLSATDGNYLMINSAVPASNEAPRADGYGVAIDIYNVTNGSYAGSFYLPHYQKIKVSEFRLQGNLIIARYAQHLVCFAFMISPGRHQ